VCFRLIQEVMVCVKYPYTAASLPNQFIDKGKTTFMGVNDPNDLSIEVLVSDTSNLLQVVFPNPATAPALVVSTFSRPQLFWHSMVYSCQLVGHSMGGSVIVRTCPLMLEHKYRIEGVVVLDVVEGEAICNLSCNTRDIVLVRLCYGCTHTHARDP